MQYGIVFKDGATGAPAFPADYDIVRRAVLQVTDIKTNRNKYYAIELHAGRQGATTLYRVYTHYGRTDDLETKPNAGQRECRYFATAAAAENEYRAIYSEKTSAAKGYREVALASSRIGSPKARGTSAGEIDAKTAKRIEARTPPATAAAPQPDAAPALHPSVARLVRYLYAEASEALTTTVAATITAKGIETPLGVLTIGQIEKGEAILGELYKLFQSGKATPSRMLDLSGEFYTVIPHRIGRTRAAVEGAVIDSMADFESKQETLQLMKDMLQVDAASGGAGVLYDGGLAAKYAALRCDIVPLDPAAPEYNALASHVVTSQLRGPKVAVRGVYAVKRAGEWESHDDAVGNAKLLFHGSRAKNWMGILSRGLVLPKIAVSMGVRRTDAGWLGNGIYFGDAVCTAAQYTSPGREGTRFVALARVALGRVKDYTKITYGLAAPPDGYDSTHGVRARAGVRSDFADDEYVIYAPRRQRLEYLVEFAA